MHTYTLKNPSKMGDLHPTYGQAYWSYTEESDIPVKFNLMQGDVENGSTIECEEYTVKKGAKGDFQQLKKVKVIGGSTITTSAKEPAGYTSKKEFQAKDQLAIRAQWAIGQAINFHMSSGTIPDIEDTANTFFKMVDRVKESK